MGFCTGSGEADGSHCCWVNGVACPHLMDYDAAVAWINDQGWTGTKLAIAMTYAQGIRWSCRIGLQVLADVSAARNNRARYEQEFAANPDYQAHPAPVWRQVELRVGLPAGSMDCYRWQGDPAGETCCYRRTDAECEADATAKGIHNNALTVRRAGGRPDG